MSEAPSPGHLLLRRRLCRCRLAPPVSTAILVEPVRRGLFAWPRVATGHSILELLTVGALALRPSAHLNQPAIHGVFASYVGLITADHACDSALAGVSCGGRRRLANRPAGL